MTTWIIIGVTALLVIMTISIYNRLVSLRNRRENAFADIDVQLKQRHDLIPQLLGSVKGYMKHEEGVLTKITEARSKAMNAGSLDGRIEAESQLSSALQGLRVQVEAYPDLKANQNFMHLQAEISDIENKLAASRRFFNSATREYNTSLQSFPANMLAGMFGFHTKPMFDVGPDRGNMDKAPEIKF
ncbi:LemA family protein [Cytophagaceae bacterium ABcell3]|nr:LemA family protein [Cytophagaceae bacterium ABcell3]